MATGMDTMILEWPRRASSGQVWFALPGQPRQYGSVSATTVSPFTNGISPYSHFSEENMEFNPQESPRHNGSVSANTVSPFTNGISSYSHFSEENMEFNPQESPRQYGSVSANTVLPFTNGISSNSHFSGDNMEFNPQESPRQYGSVSANTVSPPTNGISSNSHFSDDNMEFNPQESHIHIDKDTLSATQGRTFHPGDTTQLPAYPPGCIGHWIWKDDKEKTILGPYDYIASEPGKELRTLLLSKFNAWLQVPEKSLNIIANVVRMLHTASLLIDDIQDNSQLRRGKPVAHRIYGIAQTINAGNYVYFQALQELYKLSNPAKAIEVYTTELLNLHRGQGMDLWWRDTLTCPTVEEYLEMVSNKTGGLFRLAIRLMQIESPTSIDCVPLVELMGLIFQIVDDYKNLSDVDYTAKKGVCEDLTEGKFSFPVIHSIRADPKNSQLLHILAQRPKDIEVKKTAVQYIKSTGSFEYTRQYVERLTIQARDVADNRGEGIGGSKGIHTLLDLISIRRCASEDIHLSLASHGGQVMRDGT